MFYLGLDLGKKHDHTAIAIVEKRMHTTLLVRHLERVELGTPYPAVVARIGEIVGRMRAMRGGGGWDGSGGAGGGCAASGGAGVRDYGGHDHGRRAGVAKGIGVQCAEAGPDCGIADGDGEGGVAGGAAVGGGGCAGEGTVECADTGGDGDRERSNWRGWVWGA